MRKPWRWPTAGVPPCRRWAVGAAVLLCLLHGIASWLAMGGWRALSSDAPLVAHDHPLHLHGMATARALIARNGWPAGYDPAIMAGYPKSVVFPQSDTLLDLSAFFVRGVPIAVTYKWVVFLGLAALPWLVALAGTMLRLGAGSTAAGVALFLIYVWTDGGGGGFPLNFALYGMTTFLLSVPASLVAAASVALYLDRGGAARLAGAMALTSAAFLIHPTAAMILTPAGLASYITSLRAPGGIAPGRRLGFWAIPAVAVALNSFWWLPGLWLRETKGDSGFAFAHPEGVTARLAAIFTAEPTIQPVLLLLGLTGVILLARRSRMASGVLGGFAVAGLLWGYLAGAARSLDFLQPGRLTYALYASCALLGGVAIAGAIGLASRRSKALGLAAAACLLTMGIYLFGGHVAGSARYRLGLSRSPLARPYLDLGPTAQFRDLLAWVRANVRPGERVFYEEGGFGVPGDPEPFGEARYSGLLPEMAGVEIVGGPYLHAAVRENFTQIGEGKFFGREDWSRERFLLYARLYRPSALVCWSRAARRFCLENPDLVRISFRDGRLTAGLVLGLGGDAIRGEADVLAAPGVLRVRAMRPGPDGLVVLRYHLAPRMRSRPPVPLVPVFEADDPVPFIGLRPGPGQAEATLDMTFPLRR